MKSEVRDPRDLIVLPDGAKVRVTFTITNAPDLTEAQCRQVAKMIRSIDFSGFIDEDGEPIQVPRARRMRRHEVRR